MSSTSWSPSATRQSTTPERDITECNEQEIRKSFSETNVMEDDGRLAITEHLEMRLIDERQIDVTEYLKLVNPFVNFSTMTSDQQRKFKDILDDVRARSRKAGADVESLKELLYTELIQDAVKHFEDSAGVKLWTKDTSPTLTAVFMEIRRLAMCEYNTLKKALREGEAPEY